MFFQSDGEEYQNLSVAAKISLALLALDMIERTIQAILDASPDATPEDIANELDVEEVFGNLFEGTHSTDIASIRTANLLEHLADENFRAQFPYVMIVTQPEARFTHAVMNRYIMSSEEALQHPDLLPPYGFGCRCIAVPVSAQSAAAQGLTGANPVGSLATWLRNQGISPSQAQYAGMEPGFIPATSGADMRAQLASLRQKAEAIRREDPAGWAELAAFLLALFGFDILTQDPPQEAAA